MAEDSDSEFKSLFMPVREKLINSGLFPKGLTGACYASAFMSDFALKNRGFKSEIVANNRHCFNRVFFEGIHYILDLTATQISKDRFDDISLLPEEEARDRLTAFKKGFYDEGIVFVDSQDLLIPRKGESLRVAEPLVCPVSELIGQEALFEVFKNLESLAELQTFAGKFAFLSKSFMDKNILCSENAFSGNRRKTFLMAMNGP